MTVTLKPDKFGVPSTTSGVQITISGSNLPNLLDWNFDGPGGYQPAGSTTTYTWTVSAWKASKSTEATFTLAVPSAGAEGDLGGSSGTLTITGTDGSNSTPIQAPVETT